MPSTTRAKPAGMILVLALGALCGAQPPTASAPASSQPALDPTVDKILTRLESREVYDLHAKVSWTLRYASDAEEDAVAKSGELWYQQQKPVAKFLVHFTKKVASNRVHKLDERYLFDGRWYYALKSETKTFEKREIRRAGDVGNPYKLGEGPFPVPFGQKKADIVKEFDVSLLPAARDDPPDTDHLRLAPRAGTSSHADYKQVDVWVAREGTHSGLPVKVHAAKRDGTGKVNSFITVAFENIELNPALAAGIFQLKKPPGYEEVVETLEPIPPPDEAASPPEKPKNP